MSTPTTSKRPSPAQLRAWQRTRTLVRVHRAAIDDGYVTGRIVGHSTRLIALARIGATRPDGFEVIRRSDVTRVEAPDPYAGFVEATLRLRGEALAALPRVDLTSWQSVVGAASRRFPLVTLHTEVADPDVCYIGRPVQLTSRVVIMRTIGPDAVWDDDEWLTVAWADVTRIDLGDAYAQALSLVAGDAARKASGR